MIGFVTNATAPARAQSADLALTDRRTLIPRHRLIRPERGRDGQAAPGGQRARASLAALLATCSILALASCSDTEVAAEAPSYADGPAIGAFVPSGVWNELAPLKALERRVGGAFVLAHWYTSWDLPYDPVPVTTVLASGRAPLVTWQSHNQSVGSIAAGEHDAYIREWPPPRASST